MAEAREAVRDRSIRVGAIDCGTNSIRLLIADVDRVSGRVSDVIRRMEIVRLGYGVDRTGEIAPESMARTLAAARSYAADCREHRVDAVRFVATSASRDARNAAEFFDGVKLAFEQESGFIVTPEVISGDEEATLSFVGATNGLAAQGVGGAAGPYLVVDLGGGSTEFVRGTTSVEAARSVNIGCVRLTERHLRSDPPTEDELRAASVDIDAAIDEATAVVPFTEITSLVGLAGSVTTITAQALGLTAYEPERIHLSRVPVQQVLDAADALIRMTRAERAALGFMHPGRVDVIGAGALVWSHIVRRVAEVSGITEVVTSEHDILDGIALSVARPIG